jgi:hypothetical protein
VTSDRVCARNGCEKSLEGRKATARYCTDRCKVAAHRARKAHEAETGESQPKPPAARAVTPRDAPVTLKRRATRHDPDREATQAGALPHRADQEDWTQRAEAELPRLHKKFGKDGP